MGEEFLAENLNPGCTTSALTSLFLHLKSRYLWAISASYWPYPGPGIASFSRTYFIIIIYRLEDFDVNFKSPTITPITAFKKEWIFGAVLCSIAPFIAGTSLCFSTFTLSAISVDRFLLIYFPTRKALSRLQALIVIMIICILSTSLSAPVIFKQRLKTFGNYCGQFCTEEWGIDQSGRRIYGSIMLSVQFIVPLIIITFCYTAISFKLGKGILQRNRGQQNEWQLGMTDQQRAAVKRRQRTNRMLIGMVVAFSASWFFSVLFNVLRDYDYLPEWCQDQEYFFGIATHCIAMSSTVWNPLLYAALNLQLRAAFLRLLPECVTQLQARKSTAHNCKPLLQSRSVLRNDFTKIKY
ncbi:Prolactin-releasing peptide receptor [Dirofilaria immitis]|nr:Prolactin-releasing peptide receptor [Dirofilaria immitis]